jgi:putative intracellular protease/amidase
MAHVIALAIAHKNYQPVEYGVTKKVLENAGYTILTVSDQPGIATATDGSTTAVQETIASCHAQALDGIFFIGGSGTMAHLDNESSYELLQKMHEDGKPIGGICLGTRVLAYAGVLTGKRATGWNGDNALPEIFKEYGVNYVKEPCVVDDDIVTAIDPTAALEFAENIITINKLYMNYIKSIIALMFCGFVHLTAEYIPQSTNIPLKSMQDGEKKVWYVPTEQKAQKVAGASLTALSAAYIGYNLMGEHADPHGQRTLIQSGLFYLGAAAICYISSYLIDNKKISWGSAISGFLLGIGHANHENTSHKNYLK